MKIFRLIIVSLLLAACAAPPAATAPVEPTLAPTAAPSETPTAAISAPKYQVIYDFQELFCQAEWTNNGRDIACPTNPGSPGGSVSISADGTDMENLVLNGDTALLTWPAHDGSFLAIFGAYPPITLQAGDEFRATIGCLGAPSPNDLCNVEFSLEYYDEQGNYVDSQITGWKWTEVNDGAVHEIVVPLSGFAGRTLRLVLVVRDNGDVTDDIALWLHPQLWRMVSSGN